MLISKTGRSLKELSPDADLTVVKGFDADRSNLLRVFFERMCGRRNRQRRRIEPLRSP
jgi:hypothetical protein